MKKWMEILIRMGLVKKQGLYYIGGTDVLPPPLKGQEEQDALEALERGDEAAKQLLVEHNLRLVCILPGGLKIPERVWRT